ncbi:MAG: hypothetical protein LBL71_03165, partial [Endomicrobium sp.]|nr:hypothetical protein [Endomicrobium sp.]
MKKMLALLLVVFLLPVVHADNIFIDLDWMIVKNDKNEFVWAPLKLIPAGDLMAAGISLECPPDEAGIPLRVGVRALEYLNITTHTYRSEKVREVPNDFDIAILGELPTLEMAHSFSPLYRVFTDKYENKDAKYLQPGERSDDFMIPPQDRVILTIPKERVISVHSDVSISSDNVSTVSSVSSMWNG